MDSDQQTALAGSRSPRENRIAVIAPDGALFHGLVRAIENHVAGSFVVLLDRLPEPPGIGRPVDLVLLYVPIGLGHPADAVAACGTVFPGAAIGLVTDGAAETADIRRAFFSERLVQGLLPLSLKLDIWLAAVSLLLSGGEYYPHPASYRPDGAAGEPPFAVPHAAASVAASPSSQRPDIKGLTNREVQILQLVSEGHQNKQIAHSTGLSEHTVKVHVHNVITKLGVSNRTQAAAAFRIHLAAPAPGGPVL